MSLDHVLSGLLVAGDRHGYDLRRQYLQRFPLDRPVAAAQVYATLERLVRDGRVEPVARERVGGPDRVLYALTADGRAALDRWLGEVEPADAFVANPLSAKVTIALLVADATSARQILRRQRDSHLSRMRDFTRLKTDPGSTLQQVVAADYALDHLDADLRWIDTTVDRVTALAKEIRP